MERIDVAGIVVMAWVDEVFPCWGVDETCWAVQVDIETVEGI